MEKLLYQTNVASSFDTRPFKVHGTDYCLHVFTHLVRVGRLPSYYKVVSKNYARDNFHSKIESVLTVTLESKINIKHVNKFRVIPGGYSLI